MKKIISIILTVLLLSMTIQTVAGCSGGTSGLAYSLINDGKEYEVSIGTAWKAKRIRIPERYRGKPVTKIADEGFGAKEIHPEPPDYIGLDEIPNFTTISIPNSITVIGGAAFWNCKNLTSITIPNSVKTIGDGAFIGCENLTSITFADDSKFLSIGDYTFSYCKNLTSIIIPNSVTSIGIWAFGYCVNLTEITIPQSVTNIENRAFVSCEKLESITVDSENANYKSVDGVLFDKEEKTLVCYPMGKNGKYVIPNEVTTIGNWAFDYCKNLTEITIPNSVTTIGGGGFFYCRSLTSITIPSSITSIGVWVFSGWTKSQTIRIQMHTSAPSGWNNDWNYSCYAIIEWECE